MVAHARHGRRKAGMVGRLKEQAGEVTELLRDGARTIKEQAAETAGELSTSVKEEATRLANAQKTRAASRVQGVGVAVDKAARLLHGGKADAAAEYVDLAARSVEQASKYLEENDWAQIADDAADLIRAYPGAAIGGLLVIGVALGRFIKAGQPMERPREPRSQRRARKQAGPRRTPSRTAGGQN